MFFKQLFDSRVGFAGIHVFVPMRIGGQLNGECGVLGGIEVFGEMVQQFRSTVITVIHTERIEQRFAAEVRSVAVQLVEIYFTGSGLIPFEVINASQPTSSFAAIFGRARCFEKRLQLSFGAFAVLLTLVGLAVVYVPFGVDQIDFFFISS